MSQAEVERFIDDLKGDEALRADIASDPASLATAVKKANTNGYDFTIEEAKAFISAQAKAELSDEQLDQVVGGWSITNLLASGAKDLVN
ncbi:MAG: Nif11-like leader peptide family natural product precursor [Rhodospirillaceae bacterium]|jgi:predicted ribosomally synthesized peptide with nif11-like leader|nr:Nif11-like leader peptide family natural product precursor [Rhodospirillaceae bacterium]MBT5660231.1 Nif11-like leader peptide family natural product precursor [Rhodospirillaceae bacterium]MBT5752397.1 Nif11-like leader peptide family natural product precursor [Rhodospirillaceae bacterium]